MSINVLAELERCGIEYKWAADDEVRVRCPFHDDDKPSCSVNIEKRVFKCQAAGCEKHGDVIGLLARYLRTSRATVYADLSTRYALDSEGVIDPDVIERYHQAIWQAKPLLKALRDRCMTDDDIRKYRWGESDGRITIPIKNEGGLYVNVRKYLPGAPGPEKMRNTRGHGRPRLYPIEQLRYDSIVLVGGEAKAIAGAERELNAQNIGCITATMGEGNWEPALSQSFLGKRVWVMMDIDEAGRAAAEERCGQLCRVARWIGNVLLPLDADEYPHGDINDFLAQGRGKLLTLLEACEEWRPRISLGLEDSEPEAISLVGAMNASRAGKRVLVRAVVSVMDTAPYVIPKTVSISCDKSQPQCGLCPVMLGKDVKSMVLHPESPAILEMVGTSRSTQREALMSGLRIPRSCKVVEFEPIDFYNVEDTRVSPQLDITSRSADRPMQPAVCIGEGVDLNESYDLVGRMHPHPKTQQSTLLISRYDTAQDALSTYQPTDVGKLEIFQPAEWTRASLQRKMDGLYDDLEANVTHIFQRRDVHLTVDLAYHSPLFIDFDGKITKGWVEVLILGDSSQGKSETTMSLMKHYELGAKVECKNASVAGLLGGCQQVGSRWFVTWGIIPTHDKRLVVLEELKGAKIDVIAKLTDMRSSGIAEIPKIEKRRTHARTRLIALSNPRSDHDMSTYNFGVEAVKELIGNLEDIRRFDMALLVSNVEVDASTLNVLRSTRAEVPHVHTGDLCKQLILWAWTRSEQQVLFEDGALQRVLDVSGGLCERYHEGIPLVDRGSIRHKISRLATSLAARTFSCTPDGLSVLVRSCHVDYIVDFLDRIYSGPVTGYADYTSAIRLTQELTDPDLVRARVNETPFPLDFVKQMLRAPTVDITDIQDWCAWDKHDASHMLSFLVRKHALVRDARSYKKTAKFIYVLKEMMEKGLVIDRPDFIREQEEF